MFLAKIYIILKPTVNDPQGLTIEDGLHMLGFASVRQVRAGKYLEIQLAETDLAAAQEQVTAMCQKLLANPVIETYRFDLEPVVSAPEAAYS